MSLKFNTSIEELSQLINLHLGEKFLEQDPAWQVLDSPISGRGLFARRDINTGDVILREPALLAGPKANQSTNINTCSVCYCHLEGSDQEIMCKNGCTIPVCDACCNSQRHVGECKVFRKWKPKVTDKVNRPALRIVSIIRCLFLNENQHKLLYALQANPDKYYKTEVQMAAACFEEFTHNPDILNYFFRTICAFNTNAFEGNSCVQGHEVLIRALFPVAGLMNHQCTPNANHHFESGETIVITAARPIKQGEEIVTSYSKLLWSTLARNSFMKLTKQFECSCSRCLDPTENGTYLSALFCREQGCKGIVIPVQTKTLQPDWRCLTCETVFPHSKMARYQDFALNTINNRINACSITDMITFINEMCPRFCPPCNYVLVEAKLNVIWRMSRPTTEEFTEEQLKCKDRYRAELLELLEKLGAGECTLKKLITEENL
ncbi:SET and MYND domain containing, arthropod-specific, member 8 isoform X3 [Musca autumnalis]|uniref:SET and MYND domain containing, arthropod-specific, member 8 isoform X3 n=1 Tax=Musca autumnalis TaxID=221902 RepID=UPI003CF9F4D9